MTSVLCLLAAGIHLISFVTTGDPLWMMNAAGLGLLSIAAFAAKA